MSSEHDSHMNTWSAEILNWYVQECQPLACQLISHAGVWLIVEQTLLRHLQLWGKFAL